jgi:hypothetical protein
VIHVALPLASQLSVAWAWGFSKSSIVASRVALLSQFMSWQLGFGSVRDGYPRPRRRPRDPRTRVTGTRGWGNPVMYQGQAFPKLSRSSSYSSPHTFQSASSILNGRFHIQRHEWQCSRGCHWSSSLGAPISRNYAAVLLQGAYRPKIRPYLRPGNLRGLQSVAVVGRPYPGVLGRSLGALWDPLQQWF